MIAFCGAGILHLAFDILNVRFICISRRSEHQIRLIPGYININRESGYILFSCLVSAIPYSIMLIHILILHMLYRIIIVRNSADFFFSSGAAENVTIIINVRQLSIVPFAVYVVSVIGSLDALQCIKFIN